MFSPDFERFWLTILANRLYSRLAPKLKTRSVDLSISYPFWQIDPGKRTAGSGKCPQLLEMVGNK